MDADGAEAEGEITIAVTPENDPPFAASDLAAAVGGQTATINVLANDEDIDGDTLRVGDISRPRVGDITSDGTRLSYTPPADASGPVSLTYTAVDPDGASSQAEVTISVIEGASQPVAADDSVAVREDGGRQRLDVVGNDRDPDGEMSAHTVRLVDAPSRGDVSVDGTAVSYRPAADAVGTELFTYELCDPTGLCDSAAVGIRIAPVNDPPSFSAGLNPEAAEDEGPVIVEDWASDRRTGPSNESGQSLLFETRSSNPSLFVDQPSVDGDGDLKFTARANAFGTAAITVRAVDSGGTADGGDDTSEWETAVITVTAVNDAPVAIDDAGTVVEDDPAGVTVDVLVNDSDIEGDALAVSGFDDSALTLGSVADNGDGTFTYIPDPNVNGTDAFTYDVADGNGGSDTATVTITVTAVNDAPVASDDVGAVVEDDPAGVTVDVLVNDSDVDGDALTVAGYDDSGLTLGSVADNGDGTFTYIPDPNANGTDVFTYDVTDGNGGSDTATVVIAVTPMPDAPVANDNAYLTPDDTPLVVPAPGLLANDFDLDGDALSHSLIPVELPSNGLVVLSAIGDGGFVYTPAAGFVGTDTFSYRVNDGTGLSAVAEVSITVDATVISQRLFLGTSFNAGAWEFAGGPLPVADPEPDHNLSGDPGFELKKGDGKEDQDTPEKNLYWTYDVVGAPLSLHGPVNLELWATSKDFDDKDEARLHVRLYDCAADGSDCQLLTDSERYYEEFNNEVADWVRKDIAVGAVNRSIPVGRQLRLRLQVEKDDLWIAASGDRPSQLHITADIIPEPPVANQDAYATPGDTPLVVAAPGLLANDYDPDGDSLMVSTVPEVDPSDGSVTLGADGSFTYTPDTGFGGTDTFSYRLTDGRGLSAIGVVTVNVDSALLSQDFFLGTSLTGSTWGLLSAPLPAADPEPDHDASDDPGIFLDDGDGKETQSSADKNLYWTHDVVGSSLDLDGPVALELWATAKDFDANKKARPHVRVYDCAADGSDCQLLVETDVVYDPYNGGVADWVRKDINVGTVDHSVAVGRQLRMRLQVEHEELWIAASGDRPSRLRVTTGP